MKIKAYKYILYITTLIILSSCNNDDFQSDIATNNLINFTIQTTTDQEVGIANPSNVLISLTNTATGNVFETATDNNGNAFFDNLEPGIYTAVANLQWSLEEFEQNLGYATTSEITNFSGTKENIVINENNNVAAITLFTGKIGDLVIKQIYYAGSHLAKGASFRDQFIEIYNNANEIIYADGLLVAQVFGSVSASVFEYTLPNGQYDWTKSISNNVGNTANSNYVYADFVYKIPGTGDTYPILPGESIVIATTAVNHKAPLLDIDGNLLTVQDPTLTVDLSNADFEGFLGDYRIANGLDAANYDIQNTSVPDLEIVFLKSGKDMIFHTSGADSFIIFNHDNPDELTKYIRPGLNTGSTNIYLQIPNNSIIDAVNTNQNDPTNLYPQRMSVGLDGGNASIPNGAFSSQSVIRKVTNEINGRKILSDTNNSSVDFTYLEQALPKTFVE